MWCGSAEKFVSPVKGVLSPAVAVLAPNRPPPPVVAVPKALGVAGAAAPKGLAVAGFAAVVLAKLNAEVVPVPAVAPPPKMPVVEAPGAGAGAVKEKGDAIFVLMTAEWGEEGKKGGGNVAMQGATDRAACLGSGLGGRTRTRLPAPCLSVHVWWVGGWRDVVVVGRWGGMKNCGGRSGMREFWAMGDAAALH